MPTRPRSEEALERAEAALRRAARAARAAASRERVAIRSEPAYRALCESVAVAFRRTEARHRAAAALQLAHAQRLQTWEARSERPGTAVPSFLGGVADVTGGEVAVTLFDSQDHAALMSVSGPTARAAAELDCLLDEGPAYDCTTRGASVTTTVPAELWPSYGRAVVDLGVTSVAAAPLVAGSRRLGALVCYNAPASSLDVARPTMTTLAGALAESLLGFTPNEAGSDGWEALATATEDVAAPLHNASGLAASQLGCDPTTALALIRARAFALDESVAVVAHRVVSGELRLEW